jgi:hypothetical protein
MRRIIVGIGFILAQNLNAQIGSWNLDKMVLPFYKYEANLPYENPKVAIYNMPLNLSKDPYFLIGNYKIKLFTHVSGVFRILSGQRSWLCMNQSDVAEYGTNEASIENLTENSKTPLSGINSIASDPNKCTREFGCGYASYNYKINNKLLISRMIMLFPSDTINSGIPAFEIRIKIKNTSAKPLKIKYFESIKSNPVMLQEQTINPTQRKASYSQSVSRTSNALVVSFNSKSEIPDYIKSSKSASLFDYFPPALFFSNISKNGINFTEAKDSSGINTVFLSSIVDLARNEETELRYLIGIKYDEDIEEIIHYFQKVLPLDSSIMAIGKEWKKVLPNFDNEKNPILYREMLWNAHTLEAMATYNRYYNETFIPQGTLYTFTGGANAAERDHLQHALPTIFYNPALAKSILRYTLSHIAINGDIMREDCGFAFQNISPYVQSDSQLYLFLVLAEYLKVTNDFDFLFEKIPFYPVEFHQTELVIDRLQRTFDYFITQIGTGKHGLIKLLNSDWNDEFFSEQPSNLYFDRAESHLNTLLGIVGFTQFEEVLNRLASQNLIPAYTEKIKKFQNQISLYSKNLKVSFYNDLGARTYSARAYFNYIKDIKFGSDQMYIEPQGYLLQLDDFPLERKKILLDEISKRLINPEPFAGRCLEQPKTYSELFQRSALIFPGYMANGGIWFSTYAPVIVGAATFDKDFAKGLLLKMTMQKYSEIYPQYWPGQWSFTDCIISSLGDSPGAPQWNRLSPVYCAHAHAWSLYSYFKINDAK